MQKPHPTMFTLQSLMSDLTKVDRNHHILDSEKQENDVEHSYSVAMLCWYLQEKLHLKLDVAKILKYALIHDFVEVYAGDVNTFASKSARAQKIADEAAALQKLTSELDDFPDMIQLLNSYENRSDAEALFVWTVDKMQGMILADLDNWRPYQKINITYATFEKKHHEHLTASSPYCKEVFDALLGYCKTTYYDQPVK